MVAINVKSAFPDPHVSPGEGAVLLPGLAIRRADHVARA